MAVGFHKQQLVYAPGSPDIFSEHFSLWCVFLLPIFVREKGGDKVIATDTRHTYYHLPLWELNLKEEAKAGQPFGNTLIKGDDKSRKSAIATQPCLPEALKYTDSFPLAHSVWGLFNYGLYVLQQHLQAG